MVNIKRVYDEPAKDDGYRVLVDRLWPRGVSKEKAALDAWLKDVAPSDALRNWFGHDPARFAEFEKRYHTELKDNPAFATLKQLAKDGPVLTLLYSAHDTEHNNAVVLRDLLND